MRFDMASFGFKHEERPAGHVVTLSGQLAVTDVDGFITSVDGIVAKKPTRVVLDLSRLSYIDSTMLGILIRLNRGVMEHGGSVRIASPAQPTRKLFTTMRLDKAMPIVESVEDGLK
jgi:anti-sigma B factor antagonist